MGTVRVAWLVKECGVICHTLGSLYKYWDWDCKVPHHTDDDHLGIDRIMTDSTDDGHHEREGEGRGGAGGNPTRSGGRIVCGG